MARRFQEHKNTDQCPEGLDGCTLQDSFFYAYDKFSNRVDWGASGVDVPFDCLLKRFTDTENRRLRGRHADAGHDNAIRVAASWYLKGLQMDNPDADVDSVKRDLYNGLSPNLKGPSYEHWKENSKTVKAVFHDRFPVPLITEISEECRAAFARKREQEDADLARYHASAPAQVGRGIGYVTRKEYGATSPGSKKTTSVITASERERLLKKQLGGRQQHGSGLCPPNKVLNPATGRCVLKTGAIGKKILAAQAAPQKQPAAKKAAHQKQPAKKASPQKQPAAKKAAPQKPAAQKQIICPPDKILNPATGRCVKKTGTIGKKLLGQQSKAKAVKTSPQVATGKKIVAPKLVSGQVAVRTEEWQKHRKPRNGKERKTLYDKCGDKCFLIPEEHKYPVCAGKGNISCDYDCDGVRAARNNAVIVLNRTNLQNEKQSKDWAQRAIPAAELIGLKHCGWYVDK